MVEMIDVGIKVGILLFGLYYVISIGLIVFINTDKDVIKIETVVPFIFFTVLIHSLMTLGIIRFTEWIVGLEANLLIESWLGYTTIIVMPGFALMSIYIAIRRELTSSMDSFILYMLTIVSCHMFTYILLK